MTKDEYSNFKKEYSRQRKRVSNILVRMRTKGYDVTMRELFGQVPQDIMQEDIDYLSSIRSMTDVLEATKETAQQIEFPRVSMNEPVPTYEISLFNYFAQFEDMELISPEIAEMVGSFHDHMFSMFTREEFAQAVEEAQNEEGIEFGRLERYNLVPAIQYFNTIKVHLEQFIEPTSGQSYNEAWSEFNEKFIDLLESYRDDWYERTGKHYDLEDIL